MSDHFQILPIGKRDLLSVASIHQAAFPESALTALGREAICRYYNWQLTGPHNNVYLGAHKEGSMAGFCFAGLFNGALSGFVRENRLFLCFLVITRPWLIRNPLFRDRLTLGIQVMRNVVHRHQPVGAISQPSTARSSFGILSIAVHPKFRGCGLGSVLMAEVEKATVERGLSKMHLTVNPANVQAVRFYERLGWQRVYHEESWAGFMMKQLEV